MYRCIITLLSILFIIILIYGRALHAETLSAEKSAPSSDEKVSKSKYRSPEDGWFDISGFIDQAYGFAPVLMPITEPAVGYGVAGALAFIGKPDVNAEAGFGRPNITAVGGLGTENSTWGTFGCDLRSWKNDKIQTLAALLYASINLDYYGIGDDPALRSDPLRYNLKPAGGLFEMKYRLGNTRAWIGASYMFADTPVTFKAPDETSRLPDFTRDSQMGGFTPCLIYDSRDNMFTPIKGSYLEASASIYSKALGGDSEFQIVSLDAIQYVPVASDLTLGVRGGAAMSFNDTPFYMRPYVELRGAAAMRYQGDDTVEVEAELRWQCWKRFSLVGFAGTGSAWNDFGRFKNSQSIVTGGGGFRYELARKYGLHMGVDLAFGPDDPVIYVQFGNAWMRP